MANEKIINSRMQQKHDTEAHWLLAKNFTPMKGEVIIYDPDDHYNYPRVKIGDGDSNVNDLPFIDAHTLDKILETVDDLSEIKYVGNTATWNGVLNEEYYVGTTDIFDEPVQYYAIKLSNSVPTISDLENGWSVYHGVGGGTTGSENTTYAKVVDGEDYISVYDPMDGLFNLYIVKNSTKINGVNIGPGVYSIVYYIKIDDQTAVLGGTSFTINGYNFLSASSPTSKIQSKYIPDNFITIKDVSLLPTKNINTNIIHRTSEPINGFLYLNTEEIYPLEALAIQEDIVLVNHIVEKIDTSEMIPVSDNTLPTMNVYIENNTGIGYVFIPGYGAMSLSTLLADSMEWTVEDKGWATSVDEINAPGIYYVRPASDHNKYYSHNGYAWDLLLQENNIVEKKIKEESQNVYEKLTWDGDVNGKTTLNVSEAFYGLTLTAMVTKVSESTPSLEQIGQNWSYTFKASDSGTIKGVAYQDVTSMTISNNGSIITLEPRTADKFFDPYVIIVLEPGTFAEKYTFSETGVYFMTLGMSGVFATSFVNSLTIPGYTFTTTPTYKKQIKSELLPEVVKTEVDTTLTQEGMAADAKAVGDALKNKVLSVKEEEQSGSSRPSPGAGEKLAFGSTLAFIDEIEVNDHEITATVSAYELPTETTLSKGTATGSGNAVTDITVSGHKITLAKGKTFIETSAMGTANGVATLDASGKVPTSQLPSYVDDVLEYAAKANFPTTGETGKIYVDKTTNKTYRWSGSSYVEISASLALGETSSTAHRGDHGVIAYNHASATGNPHKTTGAEIALTGYAMGSNTGDVAATDTINAAIGKLEARIAELEEALETYVAQVYNLLGGNE